MLMRHLTAVVLVAGIIACGGSSSSDIADASYTLDDVCEKTAPKICEVRRSCCEKGSGYVESGCLSHAKTECAKDVADTRAGKATFRPERIDPCFAKLSSLFDSCYVTIDLILRVAEDLRACQAFEGQLGEGTACERTSQCAPATTTDAFVGCDEKTKKCKTTRILAERAACTIGDGLPSLCGKGLFCDADFKLMPASGTCKKSTPIGTPCDAARMPVSLECGLGNYCDKTTALCTIGKGPSAACQEGVECATLTCEGSGGSGKRCTAPETIVETEECKGP
jgi:hypothetical protein